MPPRILLFPLSLTLLAACSNGPSERDIRGAMDRDNAERMKNMTALLGERGAAVAEQLMGKAAIKSVKKIGCAEDGGNAWRCDVEYEITQGDATQTRLGKVRLVRASSGWMISE